MEAILFTQSTKKLELVKLPIPEINGPSDILVKVVFAGICGTDLHIMHGDYPCLTDGAFTLGHEICGTVIEVGPEVLLIKKGDRVALDPNCACGVCYHCRSANPHYCLTNGNIPGMNNTLGIFKNGGWAEYVIAPEVQVHKLPESISLEKAALAEPISCIAHAWDRISPVTVGQKILIIGAGIIGNLWASILHLQGHRDVTVSEPNPSRRELVKNLKTGFNIIAPATLTENSKDPTYLFHLVIDCSGSVRAVEQALPLIISGGKLCIFGVAPPQDKISIAPYDIYKRELTIVGVNINPYSFCKSLGFLESLGDRYLNYDTLGIKTYFVRDYEEALESLKKGAISKAMFKF